MPWYIANIFHPRGKNNRVMFFLMAIFELLSVGHICWCYLYSARKSDSNFSTNFRFNSAGADYETTYQYPVEIFKKKPSGFRKCCPSQPCWNLGSNPRSIRNVPIKVEWRRVASKHASTSRKTEPSKIFQNSGGKLSAAARERGEEKHAELWLSHLYSCPYPPSVWYRHRRRPDANDVGSKERKKIHPTNNKAAGRSLVVHALITRWPRDQPRLGDEVAGGWLNWCYGSCHSLFLLFLLRLLRYECEKISFCPVGIGPPFMGDECLYWSKHFLSRVTVRSFPDPNTAVIV